jgi:hypothetical protein
MKIQYKLALTLFTGVAIGLAPGTAIHAQQTKVPTAYFVAEPVISDPATFGSMDSRFQGA